MKSTKVQTLTPHPSHLTPHSSPLTPHHSPLITHHLLLLTTHHSLLPCVSSLLCTNLLPLIFPCPVPFMCITSSLYPHCLPSYLYLLQLHSFLSSLFLFLPPFILLATHSFSLHLSLSLSLPPSLPSSLPPPSLSLPPSPSTAGVHVGSLQSRQCGALPGVCGPPSDPAHCPRRQAGVKLVTHHNLNMKNTFYDGRLVLMNIHDSAPCTCALSTLQAAQSAGLQEEGFGWSITVWTPSPLRPYCHYVIQSKTLEHMYMY